VRTPWFLKTAETVALLCVVRVAWASISSGRLDASANGLPVAWYGMAGLYLVVACATPRERQPGWLGHATNVGLVLAAHACFQHAHASFVDASVSPWPVAWFDWLALGLCFLVCALTRWARSRATPSPHP
jgi:hypothetical protein